jgi:hypothetical protein
MPACLAELKRMKCICGLAWCLFLLLTSPLVSGQSTSIYVPMGGNSWVDRTSGSTIQDSGLQKWHTKEASVDTYVWFDQPCEIKIYLHADVMGKSKVKVMFQDEVRKVRLKTGKNEKTYIGVWKVKKPGYSKIALQGISKTGETFGLPVGWSLEGENLEQNTHFVKNNEGHYFHWGRRGPSVHLNYTMPAQTDVEWFYNEVTVPEKEDIIGSYFMANGFQDGYFGMQVNSEQERRILFSVWSPFTTDDPKSIPEDKKIILLKKGNDVYTGEFGNEGSGGQSFLKYNWKAGNTYRFLLQGKPSGDSTTTYTAYFFAPEVNEWKLIASFKRPVTQRHLQRIHSFLENFIPGQGNQTRKVLFGNQWVRSVSGAWLPIQQAQFSADATARKQYRLDYQGGVEDNLFYLKNCGFFNDFTEIGTKLKRDGGKEPVINFVELP